VKYFMARRGAQQAIGIELRGPFITLINSVSCFKPECRDAGCRTMLKGHEPRLQGGTSANASGV